MCIIDVFLLIIKCFTLLEIIKYVVLCSLLVHRKIVIVMKTGKIIVLDALLLIIKCIIQGVFFNNPV